MVGIIADYRGKENLKKYDLIWGENNCFVFPPRRDVRSVWLFAGEGSVKRFGHLVLGSRAGVFKDLRDLRQQPVKVRVAVGDTGLGPEHPYAILIDDFHLITPFL